MPCDRARTMLGRLVSAWQARARRRSDQAGIRAYPAAGHKNEYQEIMGFLPVRVPELYSFRRLFAYCLTCGLPGLDAGIGAGSSWPGSGVSVVVWRGAVPRAGVGAGGDVLLAWAGRTGRRQVAEPCRGGLRFAFYGRVLTEDHQDPVTSRVRQRDQAGALVAGHGRIVAEFFDVGESRVLAWARRPQAAALVAQLADTGRGWDAVVIGEYERAFYGGQYASMAPLLEHYGIELWTPEAGGRVDFHAEDHEQMMMALGLQSKREITRTRIRVRTAMAAQTREQGRYLGGRPPYGYRLADAGPHPNKAHAAWGRRAHRLEPDPGHGAGGGVDVRPAPRRAQPGPDHPRAQRRRDPVPVRRRSGAQHPSQWAGLGAALGPGDPGEPALHRAAGMEPPAH